MSSKPIYKFSLLFVLILGMLTFGMLSSVEGVNNLWYNTEKEIEATEEEDDKLEIAQYKLGHIGAKVKNISFYDFHKSIIHKMSSVWKEAYDIFFDIELVKKASPTFLPIIRNISPRYILFHRLVFYC